MLPGSREDIAETFDDIRLTAVDPFLVIADTFDEIRLTAVEPMRAILRNRLSDGMRCSIR